MLNRTDVELHIAFCDFGAEQDFPWRPFRKAVLDVMVIGVGETLQPANAR